MKLKKGEEITINIPFTYTIGEEGYNSGKILETIEDCLDEVRAELNNDIASEEMMVEVLIDDEIHTFYV